jgi:hypothetical protein
MAVFSILEEYVFSNTLSFYDQVANLQFFQAIVKGEVVLIIWDIEQYGVVEAFCSKDVRNIILDNLDEVSSVILGHKEENNY